MKLFPKPTESELSILKILWKEGPSTVRTVHEKLGEQTGYTTTLKLLQIMHEKGLVRRDDTNRTHIFRPAHPEQEMQQTLVSDLINKAFGGSAKELVMRALSTEKASKSELAEIRVLLDQMEKGKR